MVLDLIDILDFLLLDIIDMKFIVLLVDVFNDRLRLIFGGVGVVVSGGGDDDDVVLFSTDDHIDIIGIISYCLLNINSNA